MAPKFVSVVVVVVVVDDDVVVAGSPHYLLYEMVRVDLFRLLLLYISINVCTQHQVILILVAFFVFFLSFNFFPIQS